MQVKVTCVQVLRDIVGDVEQFNAADSDGSLFRKMNNVYSLDNAQNLSIYIRGGQVDPKLLAVIKFLEKVYGNGAMMFFKDLEQRKLNPVTVKLRLLWIMGLIGDTQFSSRKVLTWLVERNNVSKAGTAIRDANIPVRHLKTFIEKDLTIVIPKDKKDWKTLMQYINKAA